MPAAGPHPVAGVAVVRGGPFTAVVFAVRAEGVEAIARAVGRGAVGERLAGEQVVNVVGEAGLGREFGERGGIGAVCLAPVDQG